LQNEIYSYKYQEGEEGENEDGEEVDEEE